MVDFFFNRLYKPLIESILYSARFSSACFTIFIIQHQEWDYGRLYYFLNRLYSRCIKLNRTQISLSLMLMMVVPNPNDGNAYASGANDTNRAKDPNFISFKPKSSIYL